jgi:hypothetical protein
MRGSNHMPSYSVVNGLEVVWKNEKGWYFGHGQLILSAVVRDLFYCMYLLYWDKRRAFFWKFRIPTVASTMRTANLCALAWGKYQATGEKLSAVTQLRLSTVSLR